MVNFHGPGHIFDSVVNKKLWMSHIVMVLLKFFQPMKMMPDFPNSVTGPSTGKTSNGDREKEKVCQVSNRINGQDINH